MKFRSIIKSIVVAFCLSPVFSCTQELDPTMFDEKFASIQDQVNGINASIGELKKVVGVGSDADMSSLSKKIEELRSYVDNNLKSSKDWASSTFATLAQYQSILDELEKIRKDMVGNDAMASAITAAENSMKSWVNEQLTGYYTIAQINAKIEGLNSDLQSKLETAKSNLQAAYEQAITTAINDLEGRIDKKISEMIAKANGDLEDRVKDLEDRVTELEKEVSDLISRVQSIAVVPFYTDGSTTQYADQDCYQYFEIRPLEVAKKLVEAPLSIFSLACQGAITRGAPDPRPMTEIKITSVEYIDDRLCVYFDLHKTIYNDPTGYYDGLTARLLIDDGNTCKTSDYFGIVLNYAHKYVDLGLPSGTLWADTNESTSMLFWGSDYREKYYTGAEYVWANYPFCNGTETQLTKYSTLFYHQTENKLMSYGDNGFVDNKIILDKEDDPAYIERGGYWRTPTVEEFNELLSECTWTFLETDFSPRYKVRGPNGNSIEIPMAPCVLDGKIVGSGRTELDSRSYYWTSSLVGGLPNAAFCAMFIGGAKLALFASRPNGFAIRPVFRKETGISGVSSISSEELYIPLGTSKKLTATIDKSKANAVNTQIEWTSSDPTIAAVDYEGNVYGLSTGTATITARAVFGDPNHTQSCSVRVWGDRN